MQERRALSPRLGPGTESLVQPEGQLNLAFMSRNAQAFEALLAPEYSLHWVDRDLSATIAPFPSMPRRKSLDALRNVVGSGMQTALTDVRRTGDFGVVVSRSNGPAAGADRSSRTRDS